MEGEDATCFIVRRRSARSVQAYLGATLVVASAAFSLGLAGCTNRHQTKAPVVIAAEGKDAQSQIRSLLERWEISSPTARASMRAELELFVRRYKTDPSARQARLMLAQLALNERQFKAALEYLEVLLREKPGRLRDEAELVMAAVEIRQGKLDAGLLRLAPLEGKLLSKSAEETFYKERVSAAMLARRWRLALDSMLAWLKKPGQIKNRDTKHWITEAVSQIPAQALFRVIKPGDATQGLSSSDEAERWFERLLLENIARAALAREDARLARDLIDHAPSWLRAGPQGEALLRLSAFAQNAAQISGRSIGIVLGGANEQARSRNLRVASGVLSALRQTASELSIHYVTAEDVGSTATALATLSGQGASYLLAGVDESSAKAALSYAQNAGVPTLLMVQPSHDYVQGDYGFMMGASEAEQLAVLATEHVEPLVLGGESHPCEELVAGSGQSLFERATPHVAFLGDAFCLNIVATAFSRHGIYPSWSLGLASANGPYPEGASIQILTTETFPVTTTTSASTAGADVRGDWFSALGFDAAQLVVEALRRLPESALTDREEVRAHHQRAQAMLMQVEAPLITSSSRRFNKKKSIDRQLGIRKVAADAAGGDGARTVR